jgi:hypothetical protein
LLVPAIALIVGIGILVTTALGRSRR